MKLIPLENFRSKIKRVPDVKLFKYHDFTLNTPGDLEPYRHIIEEELIKRRINIITHEIVE